MSADIFVYLDTVQFSKNGLQNRNQIKTSQGPAWLSVPVRHQFGQAIRETLIADQKATRKHLKTLAANYTHTPGFVRWSDELRTLLETEHKSMGDLAISSTDWLLNKLGATTESVRASELIGPEGKASQLVASICGTLKADCYLTGTGALSYMDESDFTKIGCEILVQQWQPFEYEQAFKNVGFVPNLSTLDLVLNEPDNASQLIRAAGSWRALSNSA